MFRVPGSTTGLWERHSRREFLQAGALGLTGAGVLSAPQAGAGSPSSSGQYPGSFGKARQLLVLYLYGAWSQLDTFDPKPQAPEEIRGEFATIGSCLPGVSVCEHLPLSARVLDRCTLIRSMSHPWNIHAASYTLTGNPDTERIEGRQRHPDQWPYLGGVIDYLAEHGDGKTGDRKSEFAVQPRNVMLPWRQSLYARPNKRSGTFGGFLGTSYDPLWTEFHGPAPQGDPFRAITPEGRFVFGAADQAEMTADALDRRRALLSHFELQSAALRQTPAGLSYDRRRDQAFHFLATPQIRDALNLDREPRALRDQYGMTLFGQACLSARRLLEAGTKVVTVVWDEYGQTDESWDTHYDHHSRLKGYLLPNFDRAFATLLTDLDRRGMLDETLVLCLSEHGRTPKFYHTAAGAPGRDHWSRAYCQLLAGAGVPRGMVLGQTDGIAAEVTQRPVDPKEVLCTAYHLLGIDPRTELMASPGRPAPLVAGGDLIHEVLR